MHNYVSVGSVSLLVFGYLIFCVVRMCAHMHASMRSNACLHACMCVIYVCVHACVCVIYVCACMHVCNICVCACMRVCNICVCMHACV